MDAAWFEMPSGANSVSETAFSMTANTIMTPPTAPATTVTAWLLWKNGIIEDDEVMDAHTLPAVIMPARDRFVPDGRLEYHRVR